MIKNRHLVFIPKVIVQNISYISGINKFQIEGVKQLSPLQKTASVCSFVELKQKIQPSQCDIFFSDRNFINTFLYGMCHGNLITWFSGHKR